MPLHLLGKKSWNVYNADNIERVRRDEAAAKAKEEAEEQRMQEVDAERRLAILRGEEPPPLHPAEAVDEDAAPRIPGDRSQGRERKKRKRAGEDDTDFELRVARERSEVVRTSNDALRKSTSSAPIVDGAGHIDLFGEERIQGRHLKNEDAEREAAKKKKELEDQYTIRFSNAAGRDGLVGPWYANSSSRAELAGQEPPSKNVWGDEDPGRKKRDAERIVANDPLAMMKSGAAKVRQVKKERQKVEAERQLELEQLRKEEKRQERHEKRERGHRKNSERRERSGHRDERSHRHSSKEDDDHRRRSGREDKRDRNDERRREEHEGGRREHREDEKRGHRDRSRDGRRDDRKRHGEEHRERHRESTSRRRDHDRHRDRDRRRDRSDERRNDRKGDRIDEPKHAI